MKKIVAINCSPRTTWNTATLVREAAKGAVEQGAEVEVFDLYKLETFTGCVSGITVGTADSTNTVHDNRFIGITTVSGSGIHSYNNMVNGTFTP